MDFYEKAKSMLYNYVDVLTNINKSNGFESEFMSSVCDSNSENKTNETKRLIYSGYLKVVDPLSKATILCHISNDKPKTIEKNLLILGHTISDIRHSIYKNDASIVLPSAEVQRIVEMDSLAKLAHHPYFNRPTATQTVSSVELKDIQDKILTRFRRYRIPIELNLDTQELIIADCVRIKPPYNHESDYICPTRIVLQRIKHMVDSG